MKPKDDIEQLFQNLENGFDNAVPNTGHKHRFLDKLKQQNGAITTPKLKKNSYWKPLMAVAASLVVCLSTLLIMQHGNNELKGLASVSPELSQTQSFFATTIAQELAALEAKRTPETEQMIDDALRSLKILETEYTTLTLDLNQSGNDKRVIYAMIANFQNRIDILQNVLKHIEDVKNFKLYQNENTTTI